MEKVGPMALSRLVSHVMRRTDARIAKYLVQQANAAKKMLDGQWLGHALYFSWHGDVKHGNIKHRDAKHGNAKLGNVGAVQQVGPFRQYSCRMIANSKLYHL